MHCPLVAYITGIVPIQPDGLTGRVELGIRTGAVKSVDLFCFFPFLLFLVLSSYSSSCSICHQAVTVDV